ncbi:hypothetical protein HY251_12870 [bacterium]|nr:hypothetical protein [bacterium]
MSARSRRLTGALLALAAFVLAGCPREAPQPTKPAPAEEPASRPVAPAPGKVPALAPGTPLPGFEDVRPGQVYTYSSSAGTIEDEVLSRTDDFLLIRTTSVLAGNEVVSENKEPLKAPGTPLPPGEKIGEDTLDISGRKIVCEVRELKGPPQVRSWVASKYPFVLKRISGAIVMLELKRIQESRPRDDVPSVEFPPKAPK